MYSINNKYSVIYILMELLFKYREKCDWTNDLFANLVGNFPKCQKKHALLFTLHNTNSATS